MLSNTGFHFRQGHVPLLISIPHLGTEIPPEIRAQMTDIAGAVADTDWHLDRLYDFTAAMGASVLGARFSRYVIDLNRPSTGESLYPGQTTTGLCPTETFRGEQLYLDATEPDAAETARRVDVYWRPYHTKLREELNRLKAEFGAVLLWEAHSIASLLPRLFEGKLPDLNVGTNSGESCDARVLGAIMGTLRDARFTSISNGRFKGGYITRAYGQPDQGVHAVQLEMCQSTYMNETAPFEYRPDLAERVKPVIEKAVSAALQVVQSLSRV